MFICMLVALGQNIDMLPPCSLWFSPRPLLDVAQRPLAQWACPVVLLSLLTGARSASWTHSRTAGFFLVAPGALSAHLVGSDPAHGSPRGTEARESQGPVRFAQD
jgi:hypothetical protein